MIMALTLEQLVANNDKIVRAKKLKGCAEILLHSTIQFFYDDAKSKNHTAGSGVLFEINNEHFIFTAAHVYTENRKEIYVVSNNEAISLAGTLYSTPLPTTGTRKDDKIDIAILHILKSSAEKIKTDYTFLNISDLSLGHLIDIDTNYILAGYPITRTREVWGLKGQLKSEPFVANLDSFVRFNYELFNFKIDSHIAITYNNNLISDKHKIPHRGPKLEGISGSGVWHFLPSANMEIVNAKLVGIVIEQIKETENKAIVATRIDLILEFLNNQFDLKVSIPKQSRNYN